MYTVFIYPSFFCNYSCSYCYTDSSPANSNMSYVVENWYYIINSLVMADVSEVRISGGEPLIIQKLDYMVKVLYDFGLKYTITTNGCYWISASDFLNLYPPAVIWVSYHPEQINKDEWLNQLKNISSALGCTVGVNIFICDLYQFNYCFDELKDSGVSRIKLIKKTALGRYRAVSNLEISEKEYTLIVTSSIKNRIECRVEGYSKNFSGNTIDSCILNHKLLITIDPDGFVYPCCVVVRDKKAIIGSLKVQSAKEIVDNFKFIRKNLPCKNFLPLLEKKTNEMSIIS